MRTKFKAIIQQIKATEGITQATLAEKLGLHKSYLSDMINERVPITDTVLASIYELFPYMRESFEPMTTKDRLLKYIEHTGLATARFESLCGLSNGYVRNLKNQIGEDKLSNILNAFPELSKIWILTGEGSMLVNNSINTSNTSAPAVSSPIEEETKRVPLIPFEARGGQLDGFARNGVTLAQCETVPTPFKGAQFAISVRGQSMSPTYPSGCVLFISKNIADWVEWGKVYVLDTENGVIVKQLAPSSLGNDFVCCKSFNDAPEFAPFDVPKSTIFGIYRVVGALIET